MLWGVYTCRQLAPIFVVEWLGGHNLLVGTTGHMKVLGRPDAAYFAHSCDRDKTGLILGHNIWTLLKHCVIHYISNSSNSISNKTGSEQGIGASPPHLVNVYVCACTQRGGTRVCTCMYAGRKPLYMGS